MSDIPRRLGSESRLDRAIDRAVRDMMQVDPRPGFRRRVLARLDPEPVRSSMFSRIAVVAAALAVLILAVMVVVPDRRSQLPTDIAKTTTPQMQSAPQTAASVNPPAPDANAASANPPARYGQYRSRRLTGEPISMPRVANVFGDRNSAVAAASVDSDTIWPAPAPETHEGRPGTPPPLTIAPLEPPAPIVIPPLNPSGPGGGHQ